MIKIYSLNFNPFRNLFLGKLKKFEKGLQIKTTQKNKILTERYNILARISRNLKESTTE